LAGRPPPLGDNAYGLESLLEQVATHGLVLEGPDILEISSIIDAFENILSWSEGLQKVKGLSFVELPKLTACISVNTTLQDLLHDVFDKDGRLSGTTFPAVGRLRARVRSLKAKVMTTLDSLLSTPRIKSKIALESGGPLYSEVNGGRLVIPMDASKAAAVGIVHDMSRSGKTMYVEPTEIVGPTNELRQVENELRMEEAAVWRSLTMQILNNRVHLEASAAAVGQLDLVLARIMLGRRLSGVIPVVRDEGVVSVRNGKHPVLLLRGIEGVVGSQVELGQHGIQGLVLTGPNAGGKTIILKMLGLYALMARAGIPIPADPAHNESFDDLDTEEKERYHARVDFFNPVLADIGDIQSVGGDLSTFSGHMLVCREVLANAGKNALVLMDELGSGTDPAQGVAIAQALLEAIMETGARVAITTHYMQLKQLAASDSRFSVAGMQFVNGRPTYRLIPGAVGESFALAVAERLNLPAKVIARANELLDSETRQMGDLIRELEDQRALLDKQTVELEDRMKEMAKLEFKVKEEAIRLEKKQLNVRRDEAKKFAKTLEEKERVLEDILEKLKSDPSRKIVAKSWDDVKFVKRDALREAENVPSVLARRKLADSAIEEVSAELVPIAEMRERPDLKQGDAVIVCKKGQMFGREAVISKSLGGRVEVRVNGMNVSFKLDEVALSTKGLVLLQEGTSNKSKVKSVSKAVEKAIAAETNGSFDDWESSRKAVPTELSSSGTGLAMRTKSNTVDVLGCNFEDAKERSMQKFSSCLLGGRSVVYILHGHGTSGVLKSKIRMWLSSERQLVKRWQPADVSDGGDALTRVELR
jgi:DNA mismatch repair protein MutS2